MRHVLLSASTEERYERGSSVVTVYFPTGSDSLFDIARRYHTTPERIASLNSLTEECVNLSGAPESLGGLKRLIIR